MASKDLDVYIAGDHAGTLFQGESGPLTCPLVVRIASGM